MNSKFIYKVDGYSLELITLEVESTHMAARA